MATKRSTYPIDPALSTLSAESLARLRKLFSHVKEQRVPGRVVHQLSDVLAMAFCSMLSDNCAFTDMEIFCRSQQEWFKSFLDLKHDTPSHDVFRNVFMFVKPQALLSVLETWCGPLDAKHIAVDGKAMRGTYDRQTRKCQAHILRAWVVEEGLSTAHVMCDQKSNELATLPELLDSIDLNGATVTIDAMAGHPEVAAQIIEGGGHYVLALKANEKEAFETVKARFEQLEPCPQPGSPAKHHPQPMPSPKKQAAMGVTMAESIELTNGRYVHRRITVLNDLDWFDKSWKWPELKSAIRVERWTQRGQESGELTYEAHYYLSDLALGPVALGQLIRAHWSVENSCHYVLDVTFGEDHCQVRDITAAHNLSIMREMVNKVLKTTKPKASIRSKSKRAAHDVVFRTALLAQLPQL